MVNSRSKGKRVGEYWRAISGYEGHYEVSNDGRIRSKERVVKHPRLKSVKRKGGFMKLYKNKRNGYVYVQLCRDGKAIAYRVHRLVLEAFSSTDNKGLQCNHINGVKHDNRVENLEWVSQSENMQHAFREGLQKVTWGLKVICLNDGKVYESATAAAVENSGIKGESIARVCRGERSHYKGKVFAFWDDYINHSIPEYKGKYKRRSVVNG